MASPAPSSRKLLITGGSRGLGKAIADEFRSRDYEVIAPSRQDMDLSDSASVSSWIQRHSHLRPDVLINNAGENVILPIADIPLSDWERILTVNLTSAFQLIQAFLPSMRERRWGRVVNLSSMYSLISRPGRAMYSASKSGLNGLTRAAALEAGPEGVLVNAVCPGFIETEMTRQNNTPEQLEGLRQQVALRRLADPSEIARFVHFIGSEQNTFITGQTLVIDGGFSIQ